MKQFARNRILVLGYLLHLLALMGVATVYAKDTIVLPAYEQYNRGIMQGAEISHELKYKGQPTDVLRLGKTEPDTHSWGEHSCLTTSLFRFDPKAKKSFSFQMRSDGQMSERSVLWIGVRYYNQQGLLIASSGGKQWPVPNNWTQGTIMLAPTHPETAYAEVWLVKYRDAEPEGDVDHAIYVADFRLT